MTLTPFADAARLDALTGLVYELLDAHQDTIDLAGSLPGDPWRAHIDYLRALGRTGRELLALAHDTQQKAPRSGDVRR